MAPAKGAAVRGIVLLVLVATALLGLPGPAAAGGVALARCPDEAQLPPRARCGSIAVPLERSDPSLGTIDIAFALVPRRDGSRPSLGTIVPNPGGPGVAVIASPEAPYAEAFASLLDRRALLLVDPRGTGRSGALHCPALAAPGTGLLVGLELVAAIGACGRELGPRAAHYGTAAFADDIEAVRKALGLRRLDLWGDSYGTYLMTVYAVRHPAHIRSIVLSGAAPIEFDPWGRDSVAAARRAIRLVCARTEDCNGQRILRDVARLAARLRARPVAFTIVAGGRRYPARLNEAALAALVFAGGDATAYGRIPAAVASALDGDHALLRRLVETDRLVWDTILAQPFFSFPLNLAIDCHDYPRVFSYADDPAARLAAYEQALAAVDPRVFWPFSPAGWAEGGSAGGTCLEWPDDPTAASPMPAGPPLPDVPVLVLSGDLDANTTSTEGRRTAAQFPHATFVEIPNAGHTPAAWSECGAALALRFVVTLRAQPGACSGTGAPPPVAGVRPVRAAGLPLPQAAATLADRRALALVVATAADLYEQGGLLEVLGSASALRGGRYVVGPAGSIRLRDARVVRDARISGVVGIAEWLEGDLRLAGPGVPDGRLHVVVREDGSGRARGVLDGRPLDAEFG